MKAKLLVVFVLSMSGCRLQVSEDDKFTIERRDNESRDLKLSGYYFHIDEVETVTVLFLYQNGIVMSHGSFKKDEWSERERLLNSEDVVERYREIKSVWGLYQLNGDSIVIEQWHPTNGPYHVYRERGKIISDTSFVLTESKRPYGREPLSGREPLRFKQTFTFRKYLPKPDSTNEFIE